ncbi:MAG TPA: TlpA family protein disulfide reductase, partial [Myxococcales bacterium]|nr:TlpA family protein disulfide reductase [Myxococcales bacterium]
MDIALLVARLILVVVFAVAAVAKLADRAGSRQAVRDFGGPERFAAPLAIILSLAELAVAVALVPKASAWWGAIAALALLVLFAGAIGFNLVRGRKPDCHCFGQLHSRPAGWSTLARNAALAAAAAFVVVQGRSDPGLSAVAWLGELSGAEIAMLIGGLLVLAVLAVQSSLLFNVLRQNGRLLLRVEALEGRIGAPDTAEPTPEPQPGLPVGSAAPDFHLSGLYGETLTLGALRASGRPVLLLFADPNCGPCNALLPDLGRWQREHAAALTVAVITRGTPDENRAKSSEHAIVNVLLQQDREVAEAYLEQGTPAAVLIHADGTIATPLAAGAEAIYALVAQTLGLPHTAPSPSPPTPAPANGSSGNGAAAPPAPAGPKIGDPAPLLRLPDVNGRTVNLTGFRGTKTLLLFWNPGCGFCQQMLDELRAWDANPQEEAPKLLVVATGDENQLRAMGLRSPILLDATFSKASEFGANGTPMAVLVDEEGRIASELAAGAPAVMALARGDSAPAPEPASPAGAQLGAPAPTVRLPDLDGRTVDLADFRGSETLVLFWNPGCGFCQQMLDDVKAWEANPPAGAPRLLVVSTGSVEENRALGLRSPVVLDQGFSVGGAFGANGTPMALLL